MLSERKVSGDHCRCFSAGATLEAILAFVGMESQLKTKQKTKQKSSERSRALNYITCVCLISKLQCHFLYSARYNHIHTSGSVFITVNTNESRMASCLFPSVIKGK